ncbi:MAG: hypothetical protein IPM82_25950 [Saprospiraceae bacterium]|nr:hypothetical protein [Saprospiraceae bacterium]
MLQADSLETCVQRWLFEQLPKEMERLAQAASQNSAPAPSQAWLFYFLQNGHLPWSAPRWDLAKLEAVLLENFEAKIWPWVMGSRPANLLAVVERLVLSRPELFRRRLVEVVFKGRPPRRDFVFSYLKTSDLGEGVAVVSLLSAALAGAGATDEGFVQKVMDVSDTYLPSVEIGNRAFEPVLAMELFRREWKKAVQVRAASLGFRWFLAAIFLGRKNLGSQGGGFFQGKTERNHFARFSSDRLERLCRRR